MLKQTWRKVEVKFLLAILSSPDLILILFYLFLLILFFFFAPLGPLLSLPIKHPLPCKLSRNLQDLPIGSGPL